MEQAVALLHRTKEAPAGEKAGHFDQFLRLIRGVNAAPGFFEELLPLITEELMGDEDTRHFVPLFVGEACRRQKALIPMCTATISELSKHDSPDVLANVMRATGVLFRKSLIAICSGDGDVAEEDQADMWEAVREAAATLRVHTTHEHARVRNSAVMLLQVLANVLAVRDDAEGADAEEEEEADEVFSLDSIPPCHQFLDYSELKKFGQECVQQLLELLDAGKETPFQTCTVAISCLGRVARHNPKLMGSIEPVLTNTCSSNFTQALGLSKWETNSVRFAVKSTLLALLKQPRCAAYAAVLVERLGSGIFGQGAPQQAETARRIMEKARQHARGAGLKRAGSKRQADPRLEQASDVSKRARVAEAPLIPLARIPQGKAPEEWPAELVSELIVAAMKNFPPALPPHLIDVADTPLSMWPERLANPGAHAKEDGVAKGEEEAEAAESSNTATTIRNKALMNAKPLTKAVVRALSEDALRRLLLEGESAGWQGRTCVVSRLLASSEVASKELENEFVQHVLACYKERHDLAVQFLHELMMQESLALARGGASGKGRSTGAPSTGAAKVESGGSSGDNMQLPLRYSSVLLLIVQGLIEQGCGEGENAAADAQRHLTKLLADAPAIDKEAMDRVSSLCDDENKLVRQVGMSCLRATIVHHQAWRDQSLRKLLRYTIAKDDTIRSQAIRLVANKLFGLRFLGADIEKFAIDNLRKACNVNGSAAADGDAVMANAGGGAEGVDAAGVKKEGGGMHFVRDVHLFMALCAKRHELLHVLVATYVECAVDVRSSVQECVQQLGMIKAIGAESNVLLAILGDLPKGAELLLLVFVRTLTYVFDPAQHKKLLDALKGLYARTGDSRFMIYICSALSRAEVEELLPKFVGLRKEGVEAVLRRLLHSKNSPLTPEKLLLALHKLSPRKDNAKENAAAPLHEDRRGPILTAPVPSVGVGAPEQHFAFATAHDGDVAASSVIAILEAEDKQKTNDQEENRKTPLTKKKIVEAVELCFNDKAVFTTQRLAIVLQQLIDQSPLPDFFCQTVLLALKACPTLEGWIVQNILHRLSAIRQVWTMPSLWKGFIKCCHKTLPRSCGVLVNLPREKLSQAVTECEELGEPLAMYVKDQRVRGNPCPEHVLKIVDPWMHGGRGRGGGARPSAREDNMKAGSDGEAPEESR